MMQSEMSGVASSKLRPPPMAEAPNAQLSLMTQLVILG
jgi:hypothetical protein